MHRKNDLSKKVKFWNKYENINIILKCIDIEFIRIRKIIRR